MPASFRNGCLARETIISLAKRSSRSRNDHLARETIISLAKRSSRSRNDHLARETIISLAKRSSRLGAGDVALKGNRQEKTGNGERSPHKLRYRHGNK